MAFGDDYCYSDTDSCKILHQEKHQAVIDKYNHEIDQRIKLISKHYNIPVDYFKPKTIKGVTKTLGYFEYEGTYQMAKFLRAKAYMVMEDYKLSITVSGINKKAALPYILQKYGKYQAFNYFNDDMVVPAEYTGKLTHYYLDEAMEGTITDYRGKTVYYRCESGIYLEKTPYNLSLQSEYLQYLKQVQGVLI